MVPSDSKYPPPPPPPPPPSAIFAEDRFGPTANALQASISVVTALQTTSRKQIIHCKQAG